MVFGPLANLTGSASPRVGAIVKSMFFDSPAVLRMMDAKTRKVLGHFGGRVRLTAIHSIKDSTAISAPGGPPHSHLGARRKAENRKRRAAGLPAKRGWKGIKEIYYGFDRIVRSVVIGPIAKGTFGVVPPLLEEGGTAYVVTHGKRKLARYRPRPFMGPAFQQTLPLLSGMWAGSVR